LRQSELGCWKHGEESGRAASWRRDDFGSFGGRFEVGRRAGRSVRVERDGGRRFESKLGSCSFARGDLGWRKIESRGGSVRGRSRSRRRRRRSWSRLEGRLLLRFG